MFGGADQQDASEWLGFLFQHLDVESNRKCDRPQRNAPGPTTTTTDSALQTVVDFWREHGRTSDSIIDRYFKGVEVTITTCQRCNTRSTRPEQTQIVNLFPGWEDSTLEQLMRRRVAPQHISDYQCDACRGVHRATSTNRLARLPEVLVVMLVRYAPSERTGLMEKIKTRVTFDPDDVSFEPLFVPPDQRVLRDGGTSPDGDDGFGASMNYTCYGIVMHTGGSLHQGHYYSYVRDLAGPRPRVWNLCDDESVAQKVIKWSPGGEQTRTYRDVFSCSKGEPFLLFFKRKV